MTSETVDIILLRGLDTLTPIISTSRVRRGSGTIGLGRVWVGPSSLGGEFARFRSPHSRSPLEPFTISSDLIGLFKVMYLSQK